MLRFRIHDLEEFSGIKAHTIRIWEKRYGLLRPSRTDTNIRTYGIDDLKALMNVAYLNNHGWKISKLAALSEAERERLVRDVAAADGSSGEALNTLKMAMLSFDEGLFESVCTRHREQHGFRSLVEDLFRPLLEHIGILWQSSAICPAQEHFVSNIIRGKIITATNLLPAPTGGGRVHVLYLPENEIHELGLLYVNYLLRAKGEQTIYLGQSVPENDLVQVVALFRGPVELVSLFTVAPPPSEALEALRRLRAILPGDLITFRLAGNQLSGLPPGEVPPGMQVYGSMAALVRSLDEA